MIRQLIFLIESRLDEWDHIQLPRWLGDTVKPKERVNAISSEGIARGQTEAFVSRYKDRAPLSRMGRESAFAVVIAWLLRDMSANVKGQNILIDGGRSV